MLLIASANSFRSRIGKSRGKMDIFALPRHVATEHHLRGLALTTDLLKGVETADMDRLRDAGDKAACPLLLLVEPAPQPLGARGEAKPDAAVDRMRRVLTAAQRLGCSSAAMTIDDNGESEQAFDRVAERLKEVTSVAERLGVNLLVHPGPGLTSTPSGLGELIKRVGGFRLGTLPDFEQVAQAKNPDADMRRLAPYASAVIASSVEFTKNGKHKGYDLEGMVASLQAVGFDGALAVEYRGGGDPDEGVRMTTGALSAALETV